MSKKDDAIAVMPKFLTIIESDLMKATHYLKDAVKVAIVAEDKEMSEKLAEFFVATEELSNNFQSLTRKIVD